MLSNNLLGTQFKVVLGYAGAAEVDLAVENGEVEGEAGKDWTTLTSTRPQWIRDRRINILVQMGLKPHAGIPGMPMAIELARTPDDRRVMEVVFAKFGMSRPFMAPPGLRLIGSRCCDALSMPRCATRLCWPRRKNSVWKSTP